MSDEPPQNGALNTRHQKDLAARKIPLKLALRAGQRSVEHEEMERELGYEVPSGTTARLVCSEGDYVRFRIDSPGEGPRYLGPKDVPPPLFLVPGEKYGDAEKIFVVESVDKALSMTAAGFLAVGLGGVTTTLAKGSPKALGETWKQLGDLSGRHMVIVFDANRGSKNMVARAENTLAQCLVDAGAVVSVAALDRHAPDTVGPDDYIAEHSAEAMGKVLAEAQPFDVVERFGAHTSLSDVLNDLPLVILIKDARAAERAKVEEIIKERKWKVRLLQRGLKEIEQSDREAAAEVYELPPEFDICDHNMLLLRSSPPHRSICAGVLKLVREEIFDDGVNKSRRHWIVKGTSKDGADLGEKEVAVEELAGTAWVTKSFGAAISPCTTADVLRQGIIGVSSEPPTRITYTRTGWLRRDDAPPVYLHTNGAIGGTGFRVQIDGLSNFALPRRSKDPSTALELVLRLQEIAPRPVALVLLIAFAAPPLCEMKPASFSLMLCGRTGSRKTSVAAVVQAAFGDFDAASLPQSFESTANAIERTLCLAKDALVVVDDLLPDERGRRMETANKLIRGAANRAGRDRLAADGSAGITYPPRGLMLITAEQYPDSEHSNVARLLSAEVRPGDVDLEVLSALQADRERLPHAMRDYLQYISDNFETLERGFKKECTNARELFQGMPHPRITDSLAYARAALLVFCTFLEFEHPELIDSARFLRWVDEGLQELGAAQGQRTEDADPVQRALRILQESISDGTAVLLPKDQKMRNQNEVGWRIGSSVYLKKRKTWSILCEGFKRDGLSQPPMPQWRLWDRLAEQGFATQGKDRPAEVQKQLGGANQKVVEIAMPPEHELHPLGPAATTPSSEVADDE